MRRCFDGVRTFMAPHLEKIRELLNVPPSPAKLLEPDLRIVQKVSINLCLSTVSPSLTAS